MAIFLRKLKHTPKRILVSRTDRMGDFILTLPVFESIKTHLDVYLAVLCDESVKPLLDNNPFIDQIITVEQNQDKPSILKSINQAQFDTLLVLVNDPVIKKLIPELKQLPVRIGPLSKPEAILHYTHPVIQKRSRSIMNEAEYNFELLRLFKISKTDGLKPQLYLSSDEIKSFQSSFCSQHPISKTSENWVVLHPGMGGSALNLGFEFYSSLLDEMAEMPLLIWLTGSGDEEKMKNQELIDSLGPTKRKKVSNIAGSINLRDLACLISLSKFYIGPSTGPTHLSNAVNTPLITFYPPITVQSAKRWAPFRANSTIFSPDVDCKQKYKCSGEKCPDYYCMDLIKHTDIINKVREMIKL
jgi:lipopolysaccharide heptosyltransferase III